MSIKASSFKKTKIIATIGPASEEKIEQLLNAGVNGIRLNFSHGAHSWHKSVVDESRKAAKKLNRSVAIIQDLQGPKIRLGLLASGGLDVSAGQKLELCYHKKCKENHLPIQFDFSGMVKKGDSLYLRDGTIKTTILSSKKGMVVVEALNSGRLSSNHGINLPDTILDSKNILTPKDLKDLEFTYSNDIDYVALSFVQTAKDILFLQNLLKKNKSEAKVIAKIETKVATKNLSEIISAADAVMIARGDLAIETSNEEVPLIGREIIKLSRRYKKPVIMATQMLESMISSPQPTRAEVNDIASAVSLGVSCVMLSGETAMGEYPVQTVELMKRVILESESYFIKNELEIDIISPNSPRNNLSFPVEGTQRTGFIERIFTHPKSYGVSDDSNKPEAEEVQTSVGMAAITLAEQIGAKLILAETLTGSTALTISSLRPPMPIIIASPSQRVCNQMSIVWGGKAILVPKKQHISQIVIKRLLSSKNLVIGDLIVQAFGKNLSTAGGTDTIRLLEVK